jgi:hypothetical protein
MKKSKESKGISYSLTDDGVEILDKRQLTNGAIIPNFAVDLLLPIIGFKGLGVLAVLYRRAHSERRDVSANLHDLAESGRVGFKVLSKMLSLLQNLELISIYKPEGANRAFHKKTVIELLDPPKEFKAEYNKIIKEKSPTKWLIK